MRIGDLYGSVLKNYPDVLNINEMCRILGISTKTGYRLLREGRIASMKVGRSYRIPKLHLLAYLEMINDEKVS